ncbi:MAG: hypothetical protein VB144_13715 [Clostridia bacterium]|nr:hypothetical protein [Clostridia bacterium]
MIGGRIGGWVLSQLLVAPGLSLQSKAVYQAIDRMQPRSITTLGRIVSTRRDIVERECRALEAAGWLIMLSEKGCSIPVATVPDPLQVVMVQMLEEERDRAFARGECIMKKWLDLMIITHDFFDNSRPPHLDSASTMGRLECDREYTVGVVFEFNGQQHYETTPQFPSEVELANRQTRDHIKSSLSLKHNVKLIEVVETDLRLDRMQSKIPSILPMRKIDPAWTYVQGLSRVSNGYILNCLRGRARDHKNK